MGKMYSFIFYGLYYKTFNESNHIVLMNWTRRGSKWLRPNVRCYSGICLV